MCVEFYLENYIIYICCIEINVTTLRGLLNTLHLGFWFCFKRDPRTKEYIGQQDKEETKHPGCCISYIE